MLLKNNFAAVKVRCNRQGLRGVEYHLSNLLFTTIDVETRGHWGHKPNQDFAINKEVPFLSVENAPVFLGKKCPQSVVSPQVREASYLPADNTGSCM